MGLDTGLLLLDLDLLQLPAEFASPSSSPSSSAAAASSAVITSTTTSGKFSLSHASRLDDLFAQWLSLPDTQRLVRQLTFLLLLLLPSLLPFFSPFFLPTTPKTLTYPLLFECSVY
jgi:hypothetical protein